MLALSFNVEKYLGGDDRPPDVLTLTCMFFFLNFLAATQDIAVDGWALTMLKRHNVGHASTCNSVGQTAGYFLESILHNSPCTVLIEFFQFPVTVILRPKKTSILIIPIATGYKSCNLSHRKMTKIKLKKAS